MRVIEKFRLDKATPMPFMRTTTVVATSRSPPIKRITTSTEEQQWSKRGCAKVESTVAATRRVCGDQTLPDGVSRRSHARRRWHTVKLNLDGYYPMHKTATISNLKYV